MMNAPPISIGNRRKKLFCFKALWTREFGCEATILLAWNPSGAGSAGDSLAQNLRNVRRKLVAWEKTSFGNVKGLIKELEEELLQLMAGPNTVAIGLKRAFLRTKLDELLIREEIMWKQRGKAQWLQEGDLNTAYFHARASARLRKNAITRLRIDEALGPHLLKRCSGLFLATSVTCFPRNMDISTPSVVFVNGNRYPCIFSYFVQKYLAVLSVRQRGRATFEAMHYIRRILRTLEATSGLKINLEKSSIVFCRNFPIVGREDLTAILGFKWRLSMISTWGCLLLSVVPRGRSSYILKTECGQGCRVGVQESIASWKGDFAQDGYPIDADLCDELFPYP
ncbi:hypothetical protein Sango_1244700 [Sesamum angolense]|uniref:Reverse transcriptase n=1 Tax=Sesamum angolense TaxID=2727404 RepID=A0AAE1WR08_9LAMI|nr:hypothetical protein Sango_1244700 [Sesamum angolense]